MTVTYRRRPVTDPGSLSAGTPYAEQADRQENRLDSALLHAWGRVSPYLLSGLWRRQLDRLVQRAEDQEKRLIALPDERLRHAADALRGRLSSANGDLDDIASAFALARETARRYSGMRHFRVQLLGGAALMAGALAEMQTGEGKSLTALLPAIAAALSGRPVHIVTVNDYLARRDAEQFRPVYNALGLTVESSSMGSSLRIVSGPTLATSPTAPIRSLSSTTCEIASPWALAVGAHACWSTSYSRRG